MAKFLFRGVFRIMVLLYRLTGGAFGGRVQGLPVLLLTTKGRRSGRARTTPLGYFEHDGGWVVTASNAGFDFQPGWYHNLSANPQVSVEMPGRTLQARAEVARAELRRALWEQLIARAPGYDDYRRRTRREIPMVILRPIPPAQPSTTS
jgi:deazaflavin-dependent oxidoreductase (nitroreductase family)